MELLRKEDIEVLDTMVRTCYTNGVLRVLDLKLPGSIGQVPEGEDESIWIWNKQKEYFRPYFIMLQEYDMEYDFLQVYVVETYEEAETKYSKTKRFIEKGGFEKLYACQQTGNAFNEIIAGGNSANATKSIRTPKTNLYLWGITILGIIISIISLYIAFKKL